MLSIHSHSNGAELAAYFKGHLSAPIDVNETDDDSRRWFGRGAELLGLQGAVGAKEFRRLCNHRHPQTGKFLKQRRCSNARVAYDLTFSAPKSVSVMALVAADERIQAAHDAAVDEALVEAERFAMARVRRSGANEDRLTHNIVCAIFRHHASRLNDLQLHSHGVVFNVTHDPDEAGWKALQAGKLYSNSAFVTAVYRAALRRHLHQLGYSTKTVKRSFEIIGVDHEIVTTFSKRHAEIDRVEARLGSRDNARLRKEIARRYRQPKSEGDFETLRAGWLWQLTHEQLGLLTACRYEATGPKYQNGDTANKALNFAVEHIFERETVVSIEGLLVEALRFGEGDVDLAALRKAVTEHPQLIRNGDQVTTRQAILLETQLASAVVEGVGKLEPLAPDYVPEEGTTSEQAAALLSILTCRDQVIAFTGPAGAGKSHVLQQIRRAVLGRCAFMSCAPTTKAVRVLRQNGCFEAVTLAKFLRDGRLHTACKPGDVILLDEASMVSIAQMHALFQIARNVNCRIILAGDSAQHHGIEAGDALRILEKVTQLCHVRLQTILRQRTPLYVKAIRSLREGDVVSSMQAFRSLNAIREIPDEEQRYCALAQEYLALQQQGKTSAVVCATHRESDQVSKGVREALRETGVLGSEERTLRVLRPLYLTAPETRLGESYEPGDIIVPLRKKEGLEAGSKWVVKEVGRDFLLLNWQEQEMKIDLHRLGRDFSVFRPHELRCSPGDKLLIRKDGCVNARVLTAGEIVTIEEFGPQCMRVTGGRWIGHTFRHLQLAYATTSHACQGDTVDHVIIALDGRSAQYAARREFIYVAASRGREGCSFYVEDEAHLEAAAMRSGRRLGVLEAF